MLTDHALIPSRNNPKCTETAAYRTIFHSNIRKVRSFRNRQVIGSSPIVGSMLSATYVPFSLHRQRIVTFQVSLVDGISHRLHVIVMLIPHRGANVAMAHRIHD